MGCRRRNQTCALCGEFYVSRHTCRLGMGHEISTSPRSATRSQLAGSKTCYANEPVIGIRATGGGSLRAEPPEIAGPYPEPDR